MNERCAACRWQSRVQSLCALMLSPNGGTIRTVAPQGPVSVKGFRSALLHAVKKIQIDWDHAIAYGSPVPGLRGNSRSPGVSRLPVGGVCLSHEVGARRGAPDTPAAIRDESRPGKEGRWPLGATRCGRSGGHGREPLAVAGHATERSVRGEAARWNRSEGPGEVPRRTRGRPVDESGPAARARSGWCDRPTSPRRPSARARNWPAGRRIRTVRCLLHAGDRFDR